ncbi:hypothetical protein NLI96_g7951 [Meripilus lineatus]|uniref:Uncharacterized protein n=1 Tax=Meripilus lineatus TaxID=2056292 RepID=A0AAD5UY74_9APHY|nr:hypothetical protein NLI96_g7951 [Physisporinus lineatus]
MSESSRLSTPFSTAGSSSRLSTPDDRDDIYHEHFYPMDESTMAWLVTAGLLAPPPSTVIPETVSPGQLSEPFLPPTRAPPVQDNPLPNTTTRPKAIYPTMHLKFLTRWVRRGLHVVPINVKNRLVCHTHRPPPPNANPSFRRRPIFNHRRTELHLHFPSSRPPRANTLKLLQRTWTNLCAPRFVP